jgi:hypothetical protein
MTPHFIKVMLSSLLGVLALGAPARGQGTAADAELAASVEALQQQYARTFVGHPQLINGPEYGDYTLQYHQRLGHQFFLAPAMQPGTVHYNGHYFNNLRLSYDVVFDQVVLRQPTSPLTLRLINEKVRSFSIGDHRFVRLIADSSAGDVIRTGYYEVLAEGRAQVLAKRAKRMAPQVTGRFIDVEFTPVDRLLLQKGGTYYAIGKKGAVLRLLADRSKEVQRYVQDQKLRFNKRRFEASVVQLARYYNSLPPQ